MTWYRLVKIIEPAIYWKMRIMIISEILEKIRLGWGRSGDADSCLYPHTHTQRQPKCISGADSENFKYRQCMPIFFRCSICTHSTMVYGSSHFMAHTLNLNHIDPHIYTLHTWIKVVAVLLPCTNDQTFDRTINNSGIECVSVQNLCSSFRVCWLFLIASSTIVIAYFDRLSD